MPVKTLVDHGTANNSILLWNIFSLKNYFFKIEKCKFSKVDAEHSLASENKQKLLIKNRSGLLLSSLQSVDPSEDGDVGSEIPLQSNKNVFHHVEYFSLVIIPQTFKEFACL